MNWLELGLAKKSTLIITLTYGNLKPREAPQLPRPFSRWDVPSPAQALGPERVPWGFCSQLLYRERALEAVYEAARPQRLLELRDIFPDSHVCPPTSSLNSAIHLDSSR